ncbi:hypothetical protein C4573_01225 [Candidatus Woesearchaeota archaeon]|nr:MAG: hypothetical protein C4573_01225 [Candidatus Woesearchaeota archaeon]
MKSQIEIMGLAVIIILVAVGFFFIISFKLNKPQIDHVQTLRDNQFAQQYVTSLVKTNTQCGFTITELMQDCAVFHNINCTVDSCTYLNRTLEVIANKTLLNWSYTYNLSINELHLEFQNPQRNCTATMPRAAQGFELITLYGLGDVMITLDVCK